MTDIKGPFGQRLKDLREKLGYTQREMAYAVGIQMPRYNKYEIGRSEPPFEILVKLAKLTNVDLDYLIAGQEGRRSRKVEPPWGQVRDMLGVLPVPALIYDRFDQLIDSNRRYKSIFFPDQPRIAKPGTPLEVLARAWGHNEGFDLDEIETYIANRRDRKLFRKSPVEVRMGSKILEFAETIEPHFRLVLITRVLEAG